MLDAFLEVSYGHTKEAEDKQRLTNTLAELPKETLLAIASGREKLGSAENWLEQFNGTSLYNKALQLEQLEYRIDMGEKLAMAKDEIYVHKKMLELELLKEAGQTKEAILAEGLGTYFGYQKGKKLDRGGEGAVRGLGGAFGGGLAGGLAGGAVGGVPGALLGGIGGSYGGYRLATHGLDEEIARRAAAQQAAGAAEKSASIVHKAGMPAAAKKAKGVWGRYKQLMKGDRAKAVEDYATKRTGAMPLGENAAMFMGKNVNARKKAWEKMRGISGAERVKTLGTRVGTGAAGVGAVGVGAAALKGKDSEKTSAAAYAEAAYRMKVAHAEMVLGRELTDMEKQAIGVGGALKGMYNVAKKGFGGKAGGFGQAAKNVGGYWKGIASKSPGMAAGLVAAPVAAAGLGAGYMAGSK